MQAKFKVLKEIQYNVFVTLNCLLYSKLIILCSSLNFLHTFDSVDRISANYVSLLHLSPASVKLNSTQPWVTRKLPVPDIDSHNL